MAQEQRVPFAVSHKSHFIYQAPTDDRISSDPGEPYSLKEILSNYNN